MPSIITPVDLSRRPRQLIARVERLAIATAGTSFRVVIGHADRQRSVDRCLRRRMAPYGHVHLVSKPTETSLSNGSRLRNAAAKEAGDDVLLLVDADIAPDIDLFCALSGGISPKATIQMAPCIYLSRQGTLEIESGVDRFKIISEALCFSTRCVLHWAIPSSVMAVRATDYHAVGGFHEGYEGHGYEDFDFMLRLAIATGALAPSRSLLTDLPYRAPLLAEGFRGVLGTLCLSNLLDNQIAFHLFHGRDNDEAYYRARACNAALFQSRILDLAGVRDTTDGDTPVIIDRFFALCAVRGIGPSKYHALFDARPRYMLERRGIISRIVRSCFGGG